MPSSDMAEFRKAFKKAKKIVVLTGEQQATLVSVPV